MARTEAEWQARERDLLLSNNALLERARTAELGRENAARKFAKETAELKRRLDTLAASMPHHYQPSVMHMGDCFVCGNLQDAPHHIGSDSWRARPVTLTMPDRGQIGDVIFRAGDEVRVDGSGAAVVIKSKYRRAPAAAAPRDEGSRFFDLLQGLLLIGFGGGGGGDQQGVCIGRDEEKLEVAKRLEAAGYVTVADGPVGPIVRLAKINLPQPSDPPFETETLDAERPSLAKRKGLDHA